MKYLLSKKYNEYKNSFIDLFEDIDITVICEFMLYNLVFIKEELNLNTYKTTILMNLFL